MNCINCKAKVAGYTYNDMENGDRIRYYKCYNCGTEFKSEEKIIIPEIPVKEKRQVECNECCHQDVCNIKDDYKRVFKAMIGANKEGLVTADVVCNKFMPV